MPSTITLASFNIHGGVDGWGRPFDVVETCRRLDADVLVLQENWTPSDGPGVADQVAAELGYRSTVVPMARAVMFPPRTGSGWGPLARQPRGVGMRVLPPRPGPDGDARRSTGGRSGTFGIALLLRPPLPEAPAEIIDLGRQGGDPVQRVALQVRLPLPPSELVVTATHMSHLSHGSPSQLRLLARQLPGRDQPGVLMGDMNLWGPPLTAFFPGWSRAVRGRTWPSWRRLFQIDHILVTAAVQVVASEVVRLPGSDHLPVRVVVVLP